MTILKRLIIIEWIKAFIGAVLVLLLLFTIANLISGLLRGNVTASEVLFNYLLELPATLNQIVPVSCLMGSLFSINKLKNRNELTAIFAAGFSRRHYITVLVQVASVVAALQFLLSSYIQPYLRSQRNVWIEDSSAKFRNLKSKGLKASTIGSGKMWYRSGQNYFLSFSTFDQKNNIINDIEIYYLNKRNELSHHYKAELARYQGESQWELLKGKLFEKIRNEAPPEIKPFTSQFLTLQETPNDFLQIEADITILDIQKLYHYIRKIEDSGINTQEYRIMLYEKFSIAVVCIIFTLVAAISVFNPNRRSSSFGKNIFFVFVFTIFYWLVYSYSLEMGKSDQIHPILSTFGVPLLFLCFVFYHFYKNRRLS